MKTRPVIAIPVVALTLVIVAFYLTPFKLLYQHDASEGISAGRPPLKEFDVFKLPVSEGVYLRNLMVTSGILLPGIQSQFASPYYPPRVSEGGTTISPGDLSPRPHGGVGSYRIAICLFGFKKPVTEVTWTAEHAPVSIWPLVKFLELFGPTGYSVE